MMGDVARATGNAPVLARRRARTLEQRHGSVIVTVVAVGMVQMPIHKVVDVITVGHRWMPAVGAMNVVSVVTPTAVGDAPIGVDVGHLDDVLIVVIAVGAMEVAIV